MKSLADLFEDTLKDIYFAEKQIVKALPKMAKKASSEDLSDAFNTHLEETIVHVERLEQVFKLIDKAPRGKKCEAILGIIKEAEELMEEAETDTVRDAAMVGAAQAVEHYEISRYGTLIAWAEKLGMPDAADLLGQTLQEEKATDEKLTALAESEINVEAEEEPARPRRTSGRRSASAEHH